MNETVTDQPLDFLTSLSADPAGILVIALPVLLMLLVLVVYYAVGRVTAKREQAELEKAMVLPDSETTFPGEEPRVARPAIQKTEQPPESDEIEALRLDDRESWLKRLSRGLQKTRDHLGSSIASLFGSGVKIDEKVLEQLHESLYRADLGVQAADKLVAHVRKELTTSDAANWDQVAKALKEAAKDIFVASEAPLVIPPTPPWVILICGVNGVGKTTTIGKLGAHFLAANKKVLLCAADTFRAAAIDQLKVWGDRLKIDVIAHKQGADPAAVAYDAVKAAMARQVDVLIIDTAGRLHNKNDLMAELDKINRVIGKDLVGAPHETWLVIDATTGQNAVQQVKAFKEVVRLTGLVVTKLDGTAKGGVLVGVADQFSLAYQIYRRWRKGS